MNSKSSKTSDPHRLLLNLADKIDLKGKDKYIFYICFMISYHLLYTEKSKKVT